MSPQPSDAFNQSEFSKRLSGAASSGTKSLRGFTLGKSPQDDLWRLYLNGDLTHYVEFAREDAIHAEEIEPGQTMVWLNRGARVTETTSRSLPVEFLQGQVRTGFLRGLSGLTGVMALDSEGCPCSGCAHCTTSCSSLPGGSSVGLSCGC